MKRDSKRVFIDTAPIIYLLEDDERYVEIVKKKIKDVLKNGGELVISTITAMEYLVVPYRENRYDRVSAFYEFINDLDIEICDIDIMVADRAARLRAEHDSIKGQDAIQLSCALSENCDIFLTNDRQLKRINEIKIDCLS